VSYTEEGDYVQGSFVQVFARQFDAANIYRGGVGVGAPSDTLIEDNSSVAMDDNGRFIVSYLYGSARASTVATDVRAQVVNSDQPARGAAFNVSALGGVNESWPTVALGVTDLTSNYSGGAGWHYSGGFRYYSSGYFYGQAVFSFQTLGLKQDPYGNPGYGV